ncbi:MULTISPECIES: phage holin family protein [Arsenophonus]|jgi:positive regulator of sigma E activity|uniref:phage holin family protein n=1 Tax=Arsenophonus TaxID=637 RepID=UPI0015D90798|nr:MULTISPECIES: phage holin family protein [Arsenophonus]UBX30292.1 phage holin family protein [Arsenophonus apicola]
MRMPEKYSSPIAYLWGILITILSFFTLEQWVAIVGIVCTIGTFLVNWYYKRKEYKLKEYHYYEDT